VLVFCKVAVRCLLGLQCARHCSCGMPRVGLQARLASFGAAPALLLAVSFVLDRYGDHRDLDFVELFSGAGQLAGAMQAQGMTTACFEINNCKADDMLETAGWLRALRLVLRLRHGALLWAGVPCSSFVFMNRGTSRRSTARPLGDTSRPTVDKSNIICSRVVMLLMVAIARGAAWAVEQPMSSLMDLHPRFVQLKELCHMLVKTVSMHCGSTSTASH
jgi:hypothetical protein